MAAGRGRVTIVDVARRAGTSVSSASVALRGEPGVSEATRRRVLSAAELLGYRPDRRARTLRAQRSQLLGVVYTVADPFHAAVVESLYGVADPLGYGLVLGGVTGSRTASRAGEDLLQERCDALLLVSPRMDTDELETLSGRVPAVLVGSDLEAPGVDVVRSDDARGVAAAVGHLVGEGHRDVWFVDGGPAVLAAERRSGYRDAMVAHGLAEHVRLLGGRADEESGVGAAELLLREPRRPTAVLAHNDLTAFGVLLTLRRAGVEVPAEISVVGFDDTRLARLAGVELSSVDQQPGVLAEEALRRAVERAEGATGPAVRRVLVPRLVVRGSSGPVPARRR